MLFNHKYAYITLNCLSTLYDQKCYEISCLKLKTYYVLKGTRKTQSCLSGQVVWTRPILSLFSILFSMNCAADE